MNEKEKAIIVGVYLPFESRIKEEYSLEELQRLTETADGEVQLVFTQQRDAIDRAWYLGKGKIEELAELVKELETDVVIFNTELSSSQIRNIESKIDTKVIDRTQLILDIFAGRAQSREGKIQVELAQLNYLLPRLSGKGTGLSRLGGGIGTRGPGETKLETDRRHIRRRITQMKRTLNEMIKHRDLHRERRKKNEVPQVALVGYTNAGKSTLLNQLTNAGVLAEDKLFATLDPISRKVLLENGKEIILTDTVGFIQDLPHDLVAAFRSTLKEATEADLLLHVVDAHHPYHTEQISIVENILRDIKAHTIPRVTVYNKADLLDTYNKNYDEHSDEIFISSYQPEDLQRLLALIEKRVSKYWKLHTFQIPVDRGDLLAYLHRNGKLTEEALWDESTEKWRVNVELDTQYIHQELKQFELDNVE